MALTLSSSDGVSYFISRPSIIQINVINCFDFHCINNLILSYFYQSQFNSGLTQTTATVTPTRRKNIEEAFSDQSILPPKPVPYQHMAGFVTPSVNLSLFTKPNLSQLVEAVNSNEKVKSDYQFCNSSTNSNDSFAFDSDGYSNTSETSSTTLGEKSNICFSNLIIDMERNSTSAKMKAKKVSSLTKNRKSKLEDVGGSSSSASNQTHAKQSKKSTGGGRKPTRNDKVVYFFRQI